MSTLRPLAARVLALAASAPVIAASAGAADRFALTAPGVAVVGMTSESSIGVTASGPSGGAMRSVRLRLNGDDVTRALGATAPDGSRSGVVGNLRIGANTLELVADRGSREILARLVVARATAPAVACASLATITANRFPVQPDRDRAGTTITMAKLNPATTGTNALPEHCQVQGLLQARTGVSGVSGTASYNPAQSYGTTFEVRLPTQWNGRYMFQGGGGTEGSLPAATGAQTGTAGFPELRNGFAVASQNGGHVTSQLPATTAATATSPSILQVNMFFSDPQAIVDWAYNSIDVTTRTAKFLIDEYYGRAPDRSYFVGCSTSGRQGMAMTQRFPQHYDGVIAGDPFYLPPDISLSETWSLEQIIAISPKDANGKPIYWQSIPVPDQNLFTSAILAACDAKDGLVDGVIDNPGACTFDPATFVFPSSGPYGSIAPGQPLMCSGSKTATCLTPEQVNATKRIADGPRTSRGHRILSPDGTLLSGYPFDGGFMQPSGIPTRDIGTPTTLPGNIGLGSGQLPLFWFKHPDPNYDPLAVNYDTDIGLVAATSPAINNSRDIDAFLRRGGKLIFYHGLSDSGPPWPYTRRYFEDVAHRYGGPHRAADFMKLYLIPNMGHCGGNAATDQFDMLAPMVDWIENGKAPDTVIATGRNFPATLGTLTGLPTTRSRPLCPYPRTLRFTGGAGADIAAAANYSCTGDRFPPTGADSGELHRRAR